MEIQVYKRLIRSAALSALLLATAVSAPARKEKADSLVRLMKAKSIEQLMISGQQYRKSINSTFLHNGTYLISDSAMWNVDTKVINAYGNVKVIQDETILTSDKMDYYIDDNLVKFRGTLVQLENKKKNLLRTRVLDYNTRDSIATFSSGASMRDADGQIIESDSGTYTSSTKCFEFRNNVNMFSDSVFVRTSLLNYYSEEERADFNTPIDFWKGGNMLSAKSGSYTKAGGVFFLTKGVHAMSEKQEAWSDSLYFYRGTGDLLMMGRAQVQDPSRKVTGVAERIHYNDTLSQVRMYWDAAVTLETGKEERRDTIYMGADTLIYRTIRRCDISDGTVKSCNDRLADIMTDPVTGYRRKAAEDAAAAEAARKNPEGNGPKGKGPKGKGPEAPAGAAPEAPMAAEAPAAAEEEVPQAAPAELPAPKKSMEQLPDSLGAAQARKDSLMAPLNKALADIDSLVGVGHPTDSLAVPADSLSAVVAAADSLAAQADTLSPADTAAADTVKLDTTKIGFVTAIKNVRIFRKDIQMRCDSMCYCDLDSIARFYRDPVVWNDGDRQYTADSLLMLIGGGGPRKASLQSNAFVIIQEDTVSYDQIKGTEILAYFDSTDTSLKRFDALGGSSAIFYLRENDALATVNKVESKMLSGILKNGEIDHVYYFESPKNNAFPVVQLPEAEKRMKGFNWREEEKPKGPEDITTLKVKPSERAKYAARPKARFKETDKYFPGYMPGIMREIAVRDSLAKLPKPKKDATLRDSLAIRDTLFAADSMRVPSDSLVIKDKPESSPGDLLSQNDTTAAEMPVAPEDTLASRETPAQKDSVAVGGQTGVKPTEEIDPLSVPTVDPKQKRKEERELRRKLRIAARDARIAAREARWAELDRQDSLKLVAKQQKELEKQRARTRRILLEIRKQQAKDEAKLQKYIELYKKQYEREQKRKAARERTQAAKPRRKVPASPEPGQEPPGGDPVLRVDGSPDDDPVFSGSRVPRP